MAVTALFADPILFATLGASMGFMMPISTAITAMMRFGLALDLAGFVVIVTTLALLR